MFQVGRTELAAAHANRVIELRFRFFAVRFVDCRRRSSDRASRRTDRCTDDSSGRTSHGSDCSARNHTERDLTFAELMAGRMLEIVLDLSD
jgi:hypothetical protein